MSFPNKCIIIDIGNERIKLADVVRGKNNVRILKSIMINTPKGCIEDGMILDLNQLSEAIRTAIPGLRSRTREVVFTVASSKIITREVSFPDLSAKKLKSVVHLNAAEYFPVNLNDYMLDYTVVERVVKKGEKSVVVNIIAALSSLVNEYIALAANCQLVIVGLDYAGNSLSNFAKNEKFKGDNVIIDIGSESTMVTVMQDGNTKFNRNLLHGTRHIIETIAENFDVSYEEAVTISSERPLLNTGNEDNPYLKNDVNEAMNDVLNGIARLMDYYTSRNDIRFSNIYIVGGGATIYGIEEYIESYFGTTTRILERFKGVHSNSYHKFFEEKIYFSNVVGASFSDINLVPEKVAHKSESMTRLRTEILLVVLIIVSMLTISVVKIANINILDNKKARLEIELAEGQKVIEIKKEWIELASIVKFREDIEKETGNISEKLTAILNEMEKQMPNEVMVTSLADNGGTIILECVTRDKMTAAKFVQAMKGLEKYHFEKVYVPAFTEVEITPETDDLFDRTEETETETDNNTELENNGENQEIDTTYYEFSIVLTY